MSDIPKTFGALLLGGLAAVSLSGVVCMQCGFYFKTYPSDARRLKSLVSAVWILDLFHSGLVCATLWAYLVKWFGLAENINDIPWTVALTIAITALLTFLVHCFFAHRILRLSKGKWYIAGPIAILAVLRLCSACVTTGAMIRLKKFTLFTEHFDFVFTLGLALSSMVDVLIAIFMCYFLRISRSDSASNNINHVLDMLMLYAFENGSLTCAGSIVSMLCWLTMPHNRIFLGLHFVISKLYANSLLATLNARKRLREGRSQSGDQSLPIIFPANFKFRESRGNQPLSPTTDEFASKGPRLHINVEKTVESQVDGAILSEVSTGRQLTRISSEFLD